MGSIRKTRAGNWELSIRNKSLFGDGVRIFFTYDTEADAKEDERLIETALADGKMPRMVEEKLSAMASGTSRQIRDKGGELLSAIIRAWINNGHIAPTDVAVLNLIREEVGAFPLGEITYQWVEAWVDRMKHERNYAPGTIRKRVASLSRCIDWWLRRNHDIKQGNPLKLLPKGAASYTAKDARVLEREGKEARQDVTRDRRLLPGEFDRIAAALRGEKRPDRERPLSNKDGLAFPTLFYVILYTGMRLREAYLLECSWVDLKRATIKLRCSKQWYGREKWREVPIRPELIPHLKARLAEAVSPLLFPFVTDFSDKGKERVSGRLSRRFASLFAYAGCEGITEHDLRHEATCQWFELRDAAGNWLFRESEIEKIMGWEPGSKMVSRYASFRAEELAKRMYPTDG
jgi:integrase